MERTSMVFYFEWRDIINELAPEKRLMGYEALINYAEFGTIPEDTEVRLVTAGLRAQIEKHQAKFERKCEKNRENIRKRWERMQSNTTDTNVCERMQSNTTDTNVCERMQSNTTDTKHTENENENENEKNKLLDLNTPPAPLAGGSGVKGQKKKVEKGEPNGKSLVNIPHLIEFFNKTLTEAGATIPRITSIMNRRQVYVEGRAREFGKEAIVTVIRKAAASDFMNGKNDRGFRADFDWIFRPNNFPKILEGNYDNDKMTSQHNETKPTDRYAHRRGADSSANSPEDYTDTF